MHPYDVKRHHCTPLHTMIYCQACRNSPATVMLLCEHNDDLGHHFCHECVRVMFSYSDKCVFCPKRYTTKDIFDLKKMLRKSRQIILQSTFQTYQYQATPREPQEISTHDYDALSKIYAEIGQLRTKISLTTPDRMDLLWLLAEEYHLKHRMNRCSFLKCILCTQNRGKSCYEYKV